MNFIVQSGGCNSVVIFTVLGIQLGGDYTSWAVPFKDTIQIQITTLNYSLQLECNSMLGDIIHITKVITIII